MKQRFVRLAAILLLLALLLGLTACVSEDLMQIADAVGDTVALMESQDDNASKEPLGLYLIEDAAEEAPTEEPAEAPIEEPEEVPIEEPAEQPAEEPAEAPGVTYGESYETPEEVALYLHLYRELPPNFITKNQAKDKGWDNSRGNLREVAPGMSIGGDYFGNYEGVLPEGKYHECDVNYEGGYRGAERIVWSADGAIYYTNDHYESFTQLYEEWAS